MNAPIDDGGPAFPFVEPPTECNVNPGMALRDYFAGKALVGTLAGLSDEGREVLAEMPANSAAQSIALSCYNLADAMLAAREGRAQ